MDSLSQEVKKMFEPSAKLDRLRIRAANVLVGSEWTSYKKLVAEFAKERQVARRTFQEKFESRISKASEKLINEAGSRKRHFLPRGFGGDAFNKDEIRRKAQLIVRHQHRAELADIDARETSVTQSFVSQAEVRIQQREKLIGDFQTATDRRIGQERRTRSWSR